MHTEPDGSVKAAPQTDTIANRRGLCAIACALLLAGAAYRLYLTSQLPVGYDEVFVMAVGLEEMAALGAPGWIEIPIRRSAGITPLWWWVQYTASHLAGGLSLATMRVLPILLGFAAMATAYLCARRRFGRRVGIVFMGLIALSDIVAFTNSRSEFSESLALLFLVPLVCWTGRDDRSVARGMLWLGLVMTGLSKGVFVIGLCTLAELAIFAAVRGGRARRIGGLALSLVIAAIPTTTYLVVASRTFADRGVIHHDAISTNGVMELITELTFHYTTIKAHVTGGVRDAALVYLDVGIWPVTALTGLPLLAGFLVACLPAIRRGRKRYARRDVTRIGLCVWLSIGLGVILARGTAGARFHLLYLPALWLLGALWLGPYMRRPAAKWVAGASIVAWCAGVLAAGPLAWAHFSRFEPMYASDELRLLDDFRAGRTGPPDPIDRTLHIDMANYHLRRDGDDTGRLDRAWHLERAVHHARVETERAPADARAWFYLGESLRQSGATADSVCEAWRESLRIKPNDRLQRRTSVLCGGDHGGE